MKFKKGQRFKHKTRGYVVILVRKANGNVWQCINEKGKKSHKIPDTILKWFYKEVK